jgi:WD40 repeat protein
MTKHYLCRSLMLFAITLSCSLAILPSYSADSEASLPAIEVKLHKLDVRPPAVYSPDGKILAANSKTGVKLLDASSEKVLKTLDEKAERRSGMAFSRNGKLLAFANPDFSVKVWDVSSNKLVHTLPGHTMKVNGISFSRDGKLLATASADKTIKIWDVDSGKLLRTIETGSMLMQINFILDKHEIASLSLDFLIKLWDADEGKLIRRLDGNHQSFGISDDGKTLVSSQITDPRNFVYLAVDALTKKNQYSGDLNFVDLTTGKVVRRKEMIKSNFAAVAISPDNRTVAGGNLYDYSIGFRDAESEKELRRITPASWPASIQFSPDGRNVLFVTDGGDAEEASAVIIYPLDKDDVLKDRVPSQK